MSYLPVPTPEHPATWMTVGELKIGDVIVRRPGDTAMVTAIEPIRHDEKTFLRVTVADRDRPLYPRARFTSPTLVLR